jgi:hypothetical protein
MTTPSLLMDLAAWSAQVACIAAVGGVLPALLRLDAPGVRYVYFRTLLVLCLVLPWIQARRALPEGADMTDMFAIAAAGMSAVPQAVTLVPPFSWLPVLGVCIVLGVFVRGLWIAIGLVRLDRCRAGPTR